MQESLAEKTFKVLYDIMAVPVPEEGSTKPLKTISKVFIAEVDALSWDTKDSFKCMSNTIEISKIGDAIKQRKKMKLDSKHAHAQATQSTGTSAEGNETTVSDHCILTIGDRVIVDSQSYQP